MENGQGEKRIFCWVIWFRVDTLAHLVSDLVHCLCLKVLAAFNQLTNLRSIKWFNRLYCNSNSDLIIDLECNIYAILPIVYLNLITLGLKHVPLAACCCSGWLQRPHWGLLFITLQDVWFSCPATMVPFPSDKSSGKEYFKAVRKKLLYSLLSFASVQFPAYSSKSSIGRPHWSRFTGRICDPTRAQCWSSLFLKGCTLEWRDLHQGSSWRTTAHWKNSCWRISLGISPTGSAP